MSICAAATSLLTKTFKSRISWPIALFQRPNQSKNLPRSAAVPTYRRGGTRSKYTMSGKYSDMSRSTSFIRMASDRRSSSAPTSDSVETIASSIPGTPTRLPRDEWAVDAAQSGDAQAGGGVTAADDCRIRVRRSPRRSRCSGPSPIDPEMTTASNADSRPTGSSFASCVLVDEWVTSAVAISASWSAAREPGRRRTAGTSLGRSAGVCRKPGRRPKGHRAHTHPVLAATPPG
jgi:hypothetical protein